MVQDEEAIQSWQNHRLSTNAVRHRTRKFSNSAFQHPAFPSFIPSWLVAPNPTLWNLSNLKLTNVIWSNLCSLVCPCLVRYCYLWDFSLWSFRFKGYCCWHWLAIFATFGQSCSHWATPRRKTKEMIALSPAYAQPFYSVPSSSSSLMSQVSLKGPSVAHAPKKCLYHTYSTCCSSSSLSLPLFSWSRRHLVLERVAPTMTKVCSKLTKHRSHSRQKTTQPVKLCSGKY